MKRWLAPAAVVLILGAAVSAAVPGRGEEAFAKRCSGCHALDSNREGPRLRGVAGRRAGTVADFPYSEELRKSGIVWDEKTLDDWLQDPEKLVPGTNMEFRLTVAEERSAIIGYLKSLPAR